MSIQPETDPRDEWVDRLRQQVRQSWVDTDRLWRDVCAAEQRLNAARVAYNKRRREQTAAIAELADIEARVSEPTS